MQRIWFNSFFVCKLQKSNENTVLSNIPSLVTKRLSSLESPSYWNITGINQAASVYLSKQEEFYLQRNLFNCLLFTDVVELFEAWILSRDWIHLTPVMFQTKIQGFLVNFLFYIFFQIFQHLRPNFKMINHLTKHIRRVQL